MAMNAAERIGAFATRYWLRHGMEKWPTVREAARAVRIPMRDFESCEGDAFFLQGYNVEEFALGDLEVVATNGDVDAAWCGYWLKNSRRCICGRHRAEEERLKKAQAARRFLRRNWSLIAMHTLYLRWGLPTNLLRRPK